MSTSRRRQHWQQSSVTAFCRLHLKFDIFISHSTVLNSKQSLQLLSDSITWISAFVVIIIILLLGDTDDKWFCLLRSMLPFSGLSVCHVRALCSNGRRYRHNFSYILQPIVIADCVKNWLTSVDPSPQILPQSGPPPWFEHWRHSTANCGQIVRDSAEVTMESL